MKNVYMQGSSFKTVVFYLLAGQEVTISLRDILKKTNLWLEPTESEPQREYHVFFEARPENPIGTVDLHMSKVTVRLQSPSEEGHPPLDSRTKPEGEGDG
ncbi:hypothetical protein [Candidatus Palauibacter sp.]|uniref:hypothetical protein n=1 Tax=Candidatus Palauibacter sp. TaxID=3101350 RepID=UPI003CC69EDA